MPGPQADLIRALQDPALYDHPVDRFRVIETHISWVLLTGRYAYKIKKPVDLGFLDFSTLDERRHYCEEELRLNRRLAPRLYLAVVPITGSVARPAIGGPGPVIEYAVKMHQFDPGDQFDRLLAAGRLGPGLIDDLASLIARFHAGIDRAAPDSPYGTPQRVHQPVAENFTQLRPLVTTRSASARLERLHAWCEATHRRLATVLRQRKDTGFIRECHGDLHLANITLFDGEITAFDCLEFNASLRWIDTMSEIAFLTMDLEAHDQRGLAYRFLNGYLHHSGDYAGLHVLRYYQVYRAMVRAKVACLRRAQTGRERCDEDTQFRAYTGLAERYTRPPGRALVITHGLSGSGKTTLTTPLLEACGAVRLRSDVERKRLFGLPPEAHSDSRIGADLYSPAATRRTYDRLATLGETIVAAGFPVIVDATFLKRAERDRFRDLATRLGVPFLILDFHAPQALLRRWIRERAARGRDASEADLAVLDHQTATREPLTDEERQTVLEIDTGTDVDLSRLAVAVRRRLGLAQQGEKTGG